MKGTTMKTILTLNIEYSGDDATLENIEDQLKHMIMIADNHGHLKGDFDMVVEQWSLNVDILDEERNTT